MERSCMRGPLGRWGPRATCPDGRTLASGCAWLAGSRQHRARTRRGPDRRVGRPRGLIHRPIRLCRNSRTGARSPDPGPGRGLATSGGAASLSRHSRGVAMARSSVLSSAGLVRGGLCVSTANTASSSAGPWCGSTCRPHLAAAGDPGPHGVRRGRSQRVGAHRRAGRRSRARDLPGSSGAPRPGAGDSLHAGRLGARAPGGRAGEAAIELTDDGAGTHLRYEADVTVRGPVARVGGRLLTASARTMARQFFDAIERAAMAAAGGAWRDDRTDLR